MKPRPLGPRVARHIRLEGRELLNFAITDSGSCAVLNTIRFQAKLKAQDPSPAPAAADLPHYELAMLGPAHAVAFQPCSLKVCGMQVEMIDNYAKAYMMMDQLLPTSSIAMDGLQSGALVDACASASKAIANFPELHVPAIAATAAGVASPGVGAVQLTAIDDSRRFHATQYTTAQEPIEKEYLYAAAVVDRVKPLCRCQNGFREAWIQGPFYSVY